MAACCSQRSFYNHGFLLLQRTFREIMFLQVTKFNKIVILTHTTMKRWIIPASLSLFVFLCFSKSQKYLGHLIHDIEWHYEILWPSPSIINSSVKTPYDLLKCAHTHMNSFIFPPVNIFTDNFLCIKSLLHWHLHNNCTMAFLQSSITVSSYLIAFRRVSNLTLHAQTSEHDF